MVIPTEHIKTISDLINLDVEKWGKFIEFLSKFSPEKKEDFAKSLSDTTGMDIEKSRSELRCLVSLYINKYFSGPQSDKFIENVVLPSFLDSKEVHDPAILSTRIIKILSFDRTFGVYAKVFGMSGDRNNILISSRIISELQPVFFEKVEEDFKFGIIYHNLRLKVVSNKGSIQDIIISLKGKDLEELALTIKRAQDKEITMKRSFGSHYTILDEPYM